MFRYFVGRFRCGLQHFLGEKKRFPEDGTDVKAIARWRYDWHTNARQKFHLEAN